jgi:hypothetical protein
MRQASTPAPSRGGSRWESGGILGRENQEIWKIEKKKTKKQKQKKKHSPKQNNK